MVRFSCFLTHFHCHKSKKVVQQPSKPMHKTFQDSLEDQALKVSSNPLNLDPYFLKAHDDNPSNSSVEKVISSSSVENCWKPEEMNSNFSSEGYVEVHQTVSLKKSQSLGSGLVEEGFVSSGVDTEGEVYHGFSREDSLEKNYIRMFDVLDHGGLVGPIDGKGSEMELLNQYPEVLHFESFRENSDMGDPETIFSNGEPIQLKGEGHEDYAIQSSGEHANCSEHGSPVTSPLIAKSCSLPNIGACISVSTEASPSHAYMGPRHSSFEDLDALDVGKKEFLNHNFESHAIANEETDNKIFESYKDNCEVSSPDGHDSSNIQGESSAHRWDELPSKDFKIKRIEDWVTSIDIQDSNPTQEINESSYSTKMKKIPNAIGGVTIAKLDAKTTPGIEAAKSYISSLSSTSTAAQLANLGLVAIPFLSPFGNLRGLNLSGNAIVRITAGALPRGLHMLNLSKNNISTIEGLRELTRLRVLDMSHNRIFRIGHGLSSCSSLKELYLVGNKVSEVEGLHRLLKLNVLDLRFNKISTAKCLGQLAANYISLQDISLEGNPAQKNVGDEQLKKYLHGLLPHLVSFNKQPMKANSSKEAITVHQSDRGLRSEQKLTRRGSHGLATSKVSSKRSKSRYVNIPTSGIKERNNNNNNNNNNHPLDVRRKLLGRSVLSMRRSQSEGTLGTSS